jgi:hypothetical protein
MSLDEQVDQLGGHRRFPGRGLRAVAGCLIAVRQAELIGTC